MIKIKHIVKLLRPQQWYKNLIVFVGIFFSMGIFSLPLWLFSIAAFIAFCMLSSAGYIINDIVDSENDKKHPKKKYRPIASGKIKKSHALSLAIAMIIASLAITSHLNIMVFGVSGAFLLSNLLYTFLLKRYIIVDSLTISANFVMRAAAGCFAIGSPVSSWLFLCTMFLALFLAFSKRRHELILLGDNVNSHRKSLEEYSVNLADQLLSITTASLIISYSLYTFMEEHAYLMITIPVVIYLAARYLVLIYSKRIGGEAELIIKDKGMVIGLIIWAFLVFIILYFDMPYITGLLHL